MKNNAKFEEKLNCGLENKIRNMVNFHESAWKISKLGLWWDLFIQSRKCMRLNFTEKLCMMTMKNDAKFEEEMTFHFKIATTSWWLLPQTLECFKNLLFSGVFLTKVFNVWAKKLIEKLYLMALKIDAQFQGKLTCYFQSYLRNLANLAISFYKVKWRN